MELLSPAGSFESLIAAVQSGADAVYLGGEKFGARQSAVNFKLYDMKKWIDYCHLYNVKVYITVNTLAKDSELEELAEYISELAKLHVDGVIVQDFGVTTLIRSVAPELEIHASTQMTVTSKEDAKFLENLGFSRIVLSRELSFEEIKKIRSSTSCELEVFVHGALCMSYSGQCLMSSIIGGRSGNRGRCAQPCRLPYSLIGDKTVEGFLLSPKDLCLVDCIDKLKQAGVDSLKIEGRLKRAGYVSTVVGIYRNCIAESRKSSSEEIKQLRDAFERGFTGGFFCKNSGAHMMNFANSSNVSENVFSKEALDRCTLSSNYRKVPVSIHVDASIGQPLVLTMNDDLGNSVCSFSDQLCEKAVNKPISEDRLKESVLKLGDTVYLCEKITVSLDKDAIIPISVINATRRNLCHQMNMLREKRNSIEVYPYSPKPFITKSSKPEIWCEVNTPEQYQTAKSLGIKNIIAPEGICDCADIVRSPFVSKSGYISAKRVMASNIGQIYEADDAFIVGSARLNITNSLSAEFYSSYIKYGILSAELSLKEIKTLVGSCQLDCGIIAYGRLDLMLCANCAIKACGMCQNNKQKYLLKDRKGEKFPLLCTDDCALRVLNSKPIFMADKWNDIESTGVKFVNLVFTTESAEQCEKIIDVYLQASKGIKVEGLKENTFTRGHFYRGVL